MTSFRAHRIHRSGGASAWARWAALPTDDDAIEASARNGSQRDLMARLFALGMTADEIRWHSDYPGGATGSSITSTGTPGNSG